MEKNRKKLTLKKETIYNLNDIEMNLLRGKANPTAPEVCDPDYTQVGTNCGATLEPTPSPEPAPTPTPTPANNTWEISQCLSCA